MKKFILFFILLFGSLFCTSAIAQSDKGAISLTQAEIDAITDKVKQKVDIFQNELSIIVNPANNETTKSQAIKDALDLFIGKGKAYPSYDMFGNYSMHPAVTMQTTSRSRGVRTRLMTTYLDITKASAKKYKIKIEQAQSVRVDNFQQDPNDANKFLAIATYYQTYIRRSEWGTDIDHDAKTMKVYIERRVCQTPGGEMQVFVIQLGDVRSQEVFFE